MGVSAPVRHAAARATLTLPFRLPTKEAITIAELASLTGMGATFIEEQFDAGKNLSGYRFNGGAGKRHSKRIPRAWAIAFIVKHADWDDETLEEAYIAALAHFPAPALFRISDAARALVHKAK